VFTGFGLDWRLYVETNPDLFRPTDIAESHANPEKAMVKLGWKARYEVQDVVRFMIEEKS
jgi:GDPmannose 4,6-dehydratase